MRELHVEVEQLTPALKRLLDVGCLERLVVRADRGQGADRDAEVRVGASLRLLNQGRVDGRGFGVAEVAQFVGEPVFEQIEEALRPQL